MMTISPGLRGGDEHPFDHAQTNGSTVDKEPASPFLNTVEAARLLKLKPKTLSNSADALPRQNRRHNTLRQKGNPPADLVKQ